MFSKFCLIHLILWKWKLKWKWSHSVVSDSSRPHGLQPTRLLHPWDFPGKSTGVGCHRLLLILWKDQFNSVTRLCPTLCNPVDCSMPVFSVHHQLPKLAQTHVYRVSDAIQSSHPLSSSPFSSCLQFFSASGSFPMSQFFTSGGQSIGASISTSTFQLIFRTDFLQDWLVWSPCCPRDSQESSPTPHFKSINSLALSFLHSSTLTSIHDYWKNHNFD